MYLGKSIYRIKKLINEKNLEGNTQLIIIFATIFGLYVLSALIYTIYAMIQANKNDGANIDYEFAYISYFSNQLLICYIFWNLENIRIVPVREEKEADEELADAEALE